jgi:hypothetical protein
MSRTSASAELRDRSTAPEAYPDKAAHRRAWRDLARAIAAAAPEIGDTPPGTPPERPGELIVLGSGIEAVGFVGSDESRIREADHVFHCVADPATKVWIQSLRPDALDLYVLYDDAKPRYLTYMQMTEAMLHHVRRGRKVVAIFYGPGFFVVPSTPRATRPARREGHRATMRPGISALDMLCADLGIDPSQPGMQMYEATDMLIRSRRPDVGLHLVLWQVGLIGELGYRRQGYVNRNFAVLLDYLTQFYEPEHEVINYIGARYPGIDPMIERQTLAALRDPVVQRRVTGISTFYLPPATPTVSDPAMLERLGLLRPGQTVRDPNSPLRVIDRYGPREREAFKNFAAFDVPADYQWQENTAASRFILSLARDGALRHRYAADPHETLAAWRDGLSDHERSLLAQRDAGAMQIAAKGWRRRQSPGNHRFLLHLLSRKSAMRALMVAVQRMRSGERCAAADDWARTRGFDVDWEELPADFELLLRGRLLPWTGLYLDAGHRTVLELRGRAGQIGSSLRVNGAVVRGLVFEKGALRWSAADGNMTSGQLHVDIGPQGRRRLAGQVWAAGETPGVRDVIVAETYRIRPRVPLCSLCGDYTVPGGAGMLSIELVTRPEGSRTIVATLDAQPLAPEEVLPQGDRIRVGDVTIPLAARVLGPPVPDHLRATYRVRVSGSSGAEMIELTLIKDAVAFPSGTKAPLQRHGHALEWQNGPDELRRGSITVQLDPVTLRPILFGEATNAPGVRLGLRGMVSISPAEAAILRAVPNLDMPGWAWTTVVETMVQASTTGGLFLWHGWERAETNLHRMRTFLARLREDRAP